MLSSSMTSVHGMRTNTRTPIGCERISKCSTKKTKGGL
jgi:hypothetical protein